jgi:ABC-2 type transport system ATP-binding protein
MDYVHCTNDGDTVVEATGLGKRYGRQWVVRDLDLAVPAGTVLGLLGPNGAGKTTTVRMLTTLLEPDAGSARVAGYDVIRDAARVRVRIGLAGQSATVDELLTGRANLRLIGRLYHLPARVAAERADALLARFELEDAADRIVKGWSGGMRRRLDLAASLVASPPLLFLDEPTTGLDPRSRSALWDLLLELRDAGTTIVLTTQYLDEADVLADRIAVIDSGRVIADGTPEALKAEVGGERVDVTLAPGVQAEAALAALVPFAAGAPAVDADRVSIPVARGGAPLMDVALALSRADVAVADLAVRRATLDDVFLTLTDNHAEPLEEVAA